jgi:hypothetical protein
LPSPPKRPAGPPVGAADAAVVEGAACELEVPEAGVVAGKLNAGLAVVAAGVVDAAGAGAELAGVDAAVAPKRLPVAGGFAPNREPEGVEVPENIDPDFGAVESAGFGVPNNPLAAGFGAWLLSVGGGPAGVVEKLNVFVGAGVVEPGGAPEEADEPKLSGWTPAGLFWVLADAALSSFFPNRPPPKDGVGVLVVPKRPPVDAEELVVGAAFPPNMPPEGVPPVLPPSPKAGAFAGVDPGVELAVPNIDVCWPPPGVRPPKRFFGGWDAPDAGWPNSEVPGVEVAPSVMLGVPCDALDGVPKGLEAPLPLVDPKLNDISLGE